MLPKAESADELADLPVPCEAQIETARGLAFCEQIAAAPGLEALVLGPGDLAASLGVPELTIGAGAHVEYALARIAVAASAFGLQVVDGPFVVLDDEHGLRASARRSRSFGYDGKWCIHPAQVAVCNEVYAPTDGELERAQRILASSGVARLDGEMVDEANRRMAEAIRRSRRPTAMPSATTPNPSSSEHERRHPRTVPVPPAEERQSPRATSRP